MIQLPYKLLDWIDKDKLDWASLCQNPYAIEMLKQNPDKIDWWELSTNENASELLEQNLDKIAWAMCMISNPRAVELMQKCYLYSPEYLHIRIHYLSANPSKDAMEIIKKRLKKHTCDIKCFYCIDWAALSENPYAIDILEENPEKIVWRWINKNPNAIHLIEKNIDNMNGDEIELLSKNPNAIELLKKYPENINWKYLSQNPNALEMLKQNPDKINWSLLSKNTNPEAIELLRQNQYKIDWINASTNPSIFQIDYEKMKNLNLELKREIIEKTMHPDRIAKLLEQGVSIDDL